jgi:hypothetical protein
MVTLLGLQQLGGRQLSVVAISSGDAILFIYTVFPRITMTQASSSIEPEELHPSLWRASQLARNHTACVDTGHLSLSQQLPGSGWPKGMLVDLLLQQPGIGEIRLLAPALAKVAARKVGCFAGTAAPRVAPEGGRHRD